MAKFRKRRHGTCRGAMRLLTAGVPSARSLDSRERPTVSGMGPRGDCIRAVRPRAGPAGPPRAPENQLLDPYINLMGEERASRARGLPSRSRIFLSLPLHPRVVPSPAERTAESARTLGHANAIYSGGPVLVAPRALARLRERERERTSA